MKNKLKHLKKIVQINGGDNVKMTLFPNVNYKKDKITANLADGLNTFSPPLDIGEGQASYIINMNGSKYPALTVRNGRQHAFSQLSVPNIIGQRNNEFPHVLDGTVWKKWNGLAWVNVKTGLTSSTGKLVEFATGTTRFTLLFNGTDKWSYDGTNLVNLTNAPASKLIAIHKARCYVATDNDIKYCNINLLNDWTTINAAGLIDVTESQGGLSGITAYANHIVVWTESSMHELYGTGPLNYALTNISYSQGCISNESIIELNGVLYWAYYDGIYAYTGGKPQKVSDLVDGYFKKLNIAQKSKIASGSLGYSIFYSMPIDGSTNNNIILEYNTKLQKWYVHSGAIKQFTNIGNKLYGMGYDGYIYDFESGSDDAGTAIAYEWISKAFTEGTISSNQTIARMWLVVDCPIGSTMEIYTSPSIDNDDFTLAYTITPSVNEQNAYITLPITQLQNVDWYRLKIKGTGPATVYMMEREIQIQR